MRRKPLQDRMSRSVRTSSVFASTRNRLAKLRARYVFFLPSGMNFDFLALAGHIVGRPTCESKLFMREKTSWMSSDKVFATLVTTFPLSRPTRQGLAERLVS